MKAPAALSYSNNRLEEWSCAHAALQETKGSIGRGVSDRVKRGRGEERSGGGLGHPHISEKRMEKGKQHNHANFVCVCDSFSLSGEHASMWECVVYVDEAIGLEKTREESKQPVCQRSLS